MSFDKAKAYLENKGLGERIIVLDESSATVEQAAQALGVTGAEIAKTLSFIVDEKPILIVLEGTARIDNKKYRHTFGTKAKMIPLELVEQLTGHAPGGFCPFGANENVEIYLDESLKKYDKVYPAAGDDHTAVELTLYELEFAADPKAWVDVAKVLE